MSASASSTLPVSFTADGGCTVASGTVTLTGAGNCTITASQAGNATYNAATPVSQSFTIAKASQTITFGTLSGKTFGDADFAVSASTSSGLPVSYAAAGSCTATGGTVSITGAGNCTITASQAGNGNYNAATSAEQSFAIAKANQTITITAPASKTFGDAAFGVTATATSNLTAALNASGPCTLSNGSVSITGAGSCVLSATQAGNSNYNAAPDQSHTITIAKADQTLGFDLTTLAPKTYGDPSFSVVSFAARGASGTTPTFTGTTPAVCTVTAAGQVTILQAGACGITAAQDGNQNYNSAPAVPRTFVVRKAIGSLAYTGSVYVETNQATVAIPVSATFTRADAPAGAVLTNARLRFTLRTFSGSVVMSVGNVAVNGTTGVAEAVLSGVRPTTEDPYEVAVTVEQDNNFWTADVDAKSLAVFALTADRQVNGGGWVQDAGSANGKGSFAFIVNAKAGTTGSSLRGNVLYIWRVIEGGVAYDYKLKSNSWQGGSVGFAVNGDAARASFSGRGNLQKIAMDGTVVSSQGNLTFGVELLDGDLKNPKVTDQYGLTISNGTQVIRQTTLRALGGGNVKVQNR